MISKIVFILFAILALFPFVNAPIALLMGLSIALIGGNPFLSFAQQASKKALQWSIIGLGFGLQLTAALEVSKAGLWLTLTTILLVFLTVALLNRFFKLPKALSQLIASGTAICGGSAIAAVAPVIKAKNDEISMAIGAVFLLNALALFIFPALGHLLGLTQTQFGMWSAIAIHDTSSVVGAAQVYGDEALELATTIKLSRALWIIPLTLVFSFLYKGDTKAKITIPYFILGFIATMLIAYFFPEGKSVYEILSFAAKRILLLALFLIGSTMSLKKIKDAGVQVLSLASIVWIVVSVVSLLLILWWY